MQRLGLPGWLRQLRLKARSPISTRPEFSGGGGYRLELEAPVVGRSGPLRRHSVGVALRLRSSVSRSVWSCSIGCCRLRVRWLGSGRGYCESLSGSILRIGAFRLERSTALHCRGPVAVVG